MYRKIVDPDFIQDIQSRREYVSLSISREILDKEPLTIKTEDDDEQLRKIISELMVKTSNQLFIGNLMNPNTYVKRILLKWSTGIGKTIGSLIIATAMIKIFEKTQAATGISSEQMPNIFVVGNTRERVLEDLIKFPEFGFASPQELEEQQRLNKIALTGDSNAMIRAKDHYIMLKRRVTNKMRGGYFRFFGYQELVNRFFGISKDDNSVSNLIADLYDSDPDVFRRKIHKAFEDKLITLNLLLLDEFKNSLLIVDESHNLYNSTDMNSWGATIQYIIDNAENLRVIFMSATPATNNVDEYVHVMNLINEPQEYPRLKEMKHEEIKKRLTGRVSFLQDSDIREYPKRIFIGESIKVDNKEIPYLKFIKCPVSALQEKALEDFEKNKAALSDAKTLNLKGIALSETTNEGFVKDRDDYYIRDIAIPNPDDGAPLYRAKEAKTKIQYASDKWKKENKIDVLEGKFTGDFLKIDNIGKYSSKYEKLIKELIKKPGLEKIVIFHNFVKMSGVYMLAELLRKNGFIDYDSAPSDDTICAICNKTRKEHKEKINEFIEEQEELMESQEEKIADLMEIKIGEDVDEQFAQLRNVENINDETEESKYKNDKESEKSKHKKGSDNKGSNKNPGLRPDNKGSNNRPPGFGPVKSNAGVRNEHQHLIWGSEKHGFVPSKFGTVHGEQQYYINQRVFKIYNDPENIQGLHMRVLIGAQMIRESVDLKAVRHFEIVSMPINIPTFLQIIGRGIRKGSHKGLPIEDRNCAISIYISTEKNKHSIEEISYAKKVEDYIKIQEIEQIIHACAVDAAIHRDIIMSPDVLAQYDIKNGVAKPILGTLYYEPEYNNISKNPSDKTYYTYNYQNNEINILILLIRRIFYIKNIWTLDELVKEISNPPFRVEIGPQYITADNVVVALNKLMIMMNKKEEGSWGIVQNGKYFMKMPKMQTAAGSLIISVPDAHIFGSGLNLPVKIELNKITNKNILMSGNIQKVADRIKGKITKLELVDIFADIDVATIDAIGERLITGQRKSDENLLEMFEFFNLLISNSEVDKQYKQSDKKYIGFLSSVGPKIYIDREWKKLNMNSAELKKVRAQEQPPVVGFFEELITGKIVFKIRKTIKEIEEEIKRKKIKDSRLVERGAACITKTKEEMLEILRIINRRYSLQISSSDEIPVKSICNTLRQQLMLGDAFITGGNYRTFYWFHETIPEPVIS